MLLYYCYADLSECRDDIYLWLKSNSENLGLRGRVRIAFDGINVTVRSHRTSYTTSTNDHDMPSRSTTNLVCLVYTSPKRCKFGA